MMFAKSEAVHESDHLCSVSDLPRVFQKVFNQKFRYFNWIQSECFPFVYKSDINMVVAAPTGSGKTGLMELGILRALSKSLVHDTHDFIHNAGAHKIIYLAPTHALVNEKLQDWNDRFGKIGLTLLALTSEEDVDLHKKIKKTDIILTTPEKFDAITRKRRSLITNFFADIELVLIDEVHLLNDDRGNALEAIVSRIKLISLIPEMKSFKLPISRIRFIAVSATVPNIFDIGEWLQCPKDGIKFYGDEMRPVKLHTSVLGYQPSKNTFIFERHLSSYLNEVLTNYSKGKPALIFCPSRHDTMVSASSIVSKSYQGSFLQNSEQVEILKQEASKIQNSKLQALVLQGVAFHHAALEPGDRSIIENLFLSRQILVLCSTSTLAYGVNLPAYLVIIKSTRQWNSKTSSYQEYETSLCLQMAGRAGRPQFETEGHCVIMTDKYSVHKYKNLFSGQTAIESQLLNSAREHLNNEITLLTIRTMEDCMRWLKSTFLAVRIFRNPGRYRDLAKVNESDPQTLLGVICQNALKDLKVLGMINYDEAGKIEQLEPGRILSHYYLKLDTMKAIQASNKHLSIEGLLWLITDSQEFKDIHLRRAEKRQLNTIHNSGDLKYTIEDPAKPSKPLKALKTSKQKVFILIQEALSCHSNSTLDYSLRCEREGIMKIAPRIVAAATQYFLYNKCFAAVANSLILTKSMRHRMWQDSKEECRQIPGVGPTITKRFLDAGLSTISSLEESSVQVIESAAIQKYPFGLKIKAEIKQMPPKTRLDLKVLEQTEDQEIALQFKLTPEVQATHDGSKNSAYMIVGCLETDTLLWQEKLILEDIPSYYINSVAIKKICSKTDSANMTFVAAVMTERFFGRDSNASISMKNVKEIKYARNAKVVESAHVSPSKVVSNYSGKKANSALVTSREASYMKPMIKTNNLSGEQFLSKELKTNEHSKGRMPVDQATNSKDLQMPVSTKKTSTTNLGFLTEVSKYLGNATFQRGKSCTLTESKIYEDLSDIGRNTKIRRLYQEDSLEATPYHVQREGVSLTPLRHVGASPLPPTPHFQSLTKEVAGEDKGPELSIKKEDCRRQIPYAVNEAEALVDIPTSRLHKETTANNDSNFHDSNNPFSHYCFNKPRNLTHHNTDSRDKHEFYDSFFYIEE